MSTPTQSPTPTPKPGKRKGRRTLVLAPHPGPLTTEEMDTLVAKIREIAGLSLEPPSES